MVSAKQNLNITRLECKVLHIINYSITRYNLNITRLECKGRYIGFIVNSGII